MPLCLVVFLLLSLSVTVSSSFLCPCVSTRLLLSSLMSTFFIFFLFPCSLLSPHAVFFGYPPFRPARRGLASCIRMSYGERKEELQRANSHESVFAAFQRVSRHPSVAPLVQNLFPPSSCTRDLSLLPRVRTLFFSPVAKHKRQKESPPLAPLFFSPVTKRRLTNGIRPLFTVHCPCLHS